MVELEHEAMVFVINYLHLQCLLHHYYLSSHKEEDEGEKWVGRGEGGQMTPLPKMNNTQANVKQKGETYSTDRNRSL